MFMILCVFGIHKYDAYFIGINIIGTQYELNFVNFWKIYSFVNQFRFIKVML